MKCGGHSVLGLSVPDGGLTALLGPSGSGKSTLLQEMIMLRRPESEIRAHDDEVRHYGLGMDLRTVGERRLAGHSGRVPRSSRQHNGNCGADTIGRLSPKSCADGHASVSTSGPRAARRSGRRRQGSPPA
mgnify:CR=1 FL=1